MEFNFQKCIFIMLAFMFFSCADEENSPTVVIPDPQPELIAKNQKSVARPFDFWPLDSGNFWIYETSYYYNTFYDISGVRYDTIQVLDRKKMYWRYEQIETAILKPFPEFGWPPLDCNWIGILENDTLLYGNVDKYKSPGIVLRYGWSHPSFNSDSLHTFDTPFGLMENCYRSTCSLGDVYYCRGYGIVYMEEEWGKGYYFRSKLIGFTVK